MAFDAGPLPTALVGSVARTDFNAAMALIGGSFPLGKEDLGGDSVVTIKIKNLNVTTAKLALLAVTEAQLGPQAVETAKIKLLNVTEGLIGNLAVTAAKLQTDAVETLKIKALNVTKGKAELGFGRIVDRRTGSWDMSGVAFTTDGTWKVDGIDLSGILPVGAVGVFLKVIVEDDAAGSQFQVRTNATDSINVYSPRTQVANIPFDAIFYLPIDANRLLDYKGDNLAFVTLGLAVMGWVI